MRAALALPTEAEQTVTSWRACIEGLDDHRPPVPGLIWREPGARGRCGVWTAVREAMLLFVDEWGLEALRVDWTTCDLFGVHRLAGAVRVDACGAMVTIYPYRVPALDEREILLARKVSRLRFRGLTNTADSVPIWSFGRGPSHDEALGPTTSQHLVAQSSKKAWTRPTASFKSSRLPHSQASQNRNPS